MAVEVMTRVQNGARAEGKDELSGMGWTHRDVGLR